ncbi:cell wall-binding repeat-containing protein [Herbiconiux sp.]|uniref:cell wall-binding repeat-containing protein n=1 Tax=Herbiconiux sp. TaxID=1871186 RepID=UPI0025B821B7|nr:cell wall-binding repeat-containing protein [Herbiconiux sp.]
MLVSSRPRSRSIVSALVVAATVAATVFLGSTARADTAPPAERRVSIERIGGADRYEVSAALSANTFSPGVPVVDIVSGAVFSDALSASAAVGVEGGGVLLVTRDSIPPVIAAELRRLQPAAIVIVGGTATISPEVETALGAFAPVVRRIAGADRYAVSAAVADAAFTRRVPVAYVASGETFPDALSGGAAAGHGRGPVLLTQRGAVPSDVLAYLARNQPRTIVLLGGVNSVSDAVFSQLNAIAPVVRIAGSDRYEVSVGISSTTVPDQSGPHVYIASGAGFADALSGGPAAISADGPLLLVERDSIPPSVAAELVRMKPSEITVLGGENSVSAATLAALGRL